jgi:hypothetical protein
VTNLGGKWPSTLVLFAVNPLTVPGLVDGYYLLVAVGAVLGVGWTWYFGDKLSRLSELPKEAWRVPRHDVDKEF